MASVSRFLTTKLRLTVNEAKSAVARPEERKFLGFSISNDGSERRIAPKALDKFKMQIRELTRRTRGISLPQLIEDLTPYLIGWRGYFSFCQTPRVLTNLDAWIRRRLRTYLWRQWKTGTGKSYADVASQSSMQRSPPVHRRDSGACPDTRRSNKPCETTISTRSVFRDWVALPTLNPVEPPWYVTLCPVVGEGWHREVSPYPRSIPFLENHSLRRRLWIVTPRDGAAAGWTGKHQLIFIRQGYLTRCSTSESGDDPRRISPRCPQSCPQPWHHGLHSGWPNIPARAGPRILPAEGRAPTRARRSLFERPKSD